MMLSHHGATSFAEENQLSRRSLLGGLNKDSSLFCIQLNHGEIGSTDFNWLTHF